MMLSNLWGMFYVMVLQVSMPMGLQTSAIIAETYSQLPCLKANSTLPLHSRRIPPPPSHLPTLHAMVHIILLSRAVKFLVHDTKLVMGWNA